jgi:hypothetical protein
MKDQTVAVDQAANIGIQFQGKRPSGPAFIIWSIPTKSPLADAAGKAGDADGFSPWRNALRRIAYPSGDALLRNPITGIADCCARTVSGHATAAPPRTVMNSRRRIWPRREHVLCNAWTLALCGRAASDV